MMPDPVPYAQHEREMLELIEQRDRAEDWADRLAAALAPPDVLGEHSSGNDPWRNALDYADRLRPAPQVFFPGDTVPAGMAVVNHVGGVWRHHADRLVKTGYAVEIQLPVAVELDAIVDAVRAEREGQ
jgi:hypothetical protein